MTEELKQQIERVKALDPEKLKREGRDFEFMDVHPRLKLVVEAVGELEKSEEWVSSLPLEALQRLTASLGSFTQTAEEMSNFNPGELGNPQAERDSLAERVQSHYRELYDLLIRPMEIEQLRRRAARGAVTRASARSEEQLERIDRVEKEIEGLLEAAKQSTGQAGLTGSGRNFNQQADAHQDSARNWLLASVGLIVVTFGYLVLDAIPATVKLINDGKESSQIISLTLVKLFLAAVGYFALRQTVRNYSTNMHLQTLNRHRSNVLQTYSALVGSSDDPATRDALLLKAAEAIFQAGETGYLAKGGEKEGIEVMQVVDEVRKTIR